MAKPLDATDCPHLASFDIQQFIDRKAKTCPPDFKPEFCKVYLSSGML